jgi:hypothetical protein
MIWNSLHAHAQAIKSAVSLVNDQQYSARARRGAAMYLDTLLNEYEFLDTRMVNSFGELIGYAIRVSKHDQARELIKQ